MKSDSIRLIFLFLFFMLLANNLESKALSINKHDKTDKQDKKYTYWVTALSMNGKPRHTNAKILPYASIKAPTAKKTKISESSALENLSTIKSKESKLPTAESKIIKTMSLGGFDSLDLFVLKGAKADMLNLVYDTLMYQSLDEPYAIYPLIADKVSIASDYSGVRFHINPKARFNDGSKITADDVKFSFDMLLERGDPVQSRYYADVSGAKVITDSVIEFNFKHNENKELPFILSQLMIVPRHFYLKGRENDYGAKPLRVPLGSGPYRVESFKVNSQIIYAKNQSYWGSDLMVNRGAYNFSKIIIEYYKDENVALQAFLAGQYDFRFEPQAKAWATSYKNPHNRFTKYEFIHSLPAGMQGFYLNSRMPLLQNPKVREAILQAFDFEWSNKYLFYSQYKRTSSYYENSIYASRGKISKAEVEVLKGLGIVELNLESGIKGCEFERKRSGEQMIGKSKSESKMQDPSLENLYVDSTAHLQISCLKIAEKYKVDIDPRVLSQAYIPPRTDPPHSKRENLKYAKKLLESARYHVEKNVLVDSKGEPLRLSILLNSPLFERVVLPFKKNLAILGIQLDVALVDSTQYENRVKKFDYDIMIGVVPQSLFPGSEQDFFFSSLSADMSGSRNFSGVKNAAVDVLIKELNKTQDFKRRVAILRAMDRILLWGFYVVPHYYAPSFRMAVDNKIRMPVASVSSDEKNAKSGDETPNAKGSKKDISGVKTPIFPRYGSPFSAFYFWWK